MVRLRACGFIIVVREQRGRSPGAILKNVFRSSSVFGAPVKVFSCIFEALIDRAKAAGIQMSETRRGATSYHCTLGSDPLHQDLRSDRTISNGGCDFQHQLPRGLK